MNALSQAMLDGDRSTPLPTSLAATPTVKAVVVLGSEKAFAAGADIKRVRRPGRGPQRSVPRSAAPSTALAAIPRPVIAAISGFALGGGLELALACDLRIAPTRRGSGQPEILLGIIPGARRARSGCPRLIGPARAKELIWSGRQVKADEALAIGLVDRVVPADEPQAAAARVGDASSASGAVAAMGLAKRAVDDGLDGSLARRTDSRPRRSSRCFGTEDAAPASQSFLEHGPGKAAFSGR